MPSVQTTGNLLLVFLSTIETLRALLVQPAFIVWKVLELSGHDFCDIYLFTVLGNNLCTMGSFQQTCFLITIERYMSVFHPIFHRKAVVKRAFKIAFVFFMSAWGFYLIFVFLRSRALHRIYFASSCLAVVFFLLSTAFVYVRIRARMRQPPMSHFNATELRTASKRAADRRMNNTVISIILITLACYLPLFSMLVFLSFHERTVWHTRFVIPWVYLSMFCTSAVNPFVYCWKNRRLRNEMLKFTTRFFTNKSQTYVGSTVSTTAISQTTKV